MIIRENMECTACSHLAVRLRYDTFAPPTCPKCGAGLCPRRLAPLQRTDVLADTSEYGAISPGTIGLTTMIMGNREVTARDVDAAVARAHRAHGRPGVEINVRSPGERDAAEDIKHEQWARLKRLGLTEAKAEQKIIRDRMAATAAAEARATGGDPIKAATIAKKLAPTTRDVAAGNLVGKRPTQTE